MPLVKFDYIVSFSSEDREHPASNLLSCEVSKNKKWLCAAGETSASVVLQLNKAVQIGTVAVGGHQAALVEVLVGRSETPADPYQVIVASSVFLSPIESRKGEGGERVRSFSGSEGVWAQRWDRVRVVVSQPYNKHCKFGLSFVHVFSPDGTAVTPDPAPTVASAPTVAFAPTVASAPVSSDEEEFKPGELFRRHQQRASSSTSADTGSQIRRATSEVLRTSTTSNAKLVKRQTPAHERDHTTHGPRPKVDRSDRDEKRKRGTSRERDTDNEFKKKKDSLVRDGARDHSPSTSRDTGVSAAERETRKRMKDDGSKPLAGVVCVLSGYQGTERQRLRASALALGATVLPAWDHTCTHLICAFPNTPKLRAVRAAPGGRDVPVVTASWVRRCTQARARLPERWFSTEPDRRVPEDEDYDYESRPPRSRGESDEDEGETTDEEGAGAGAGAREDVARGRALPPLLRDMVFTAHARAAHVARYVRAYGGALRPGPGPGAGARRLRLRWLWRVHRDRTLPPLHEYFADV